MLIHTHTTGAWPQYFVLNKHGSLRLLQSRTGAPAMCPGQVPSLILTIDEAEKAHCYWNYRQLLGGEIESRVRGYYCSWQCMFVRFKKLSHLRTAIRFNNRKRRVNSKYPSHVYLSSLLQCQSEAWKQSSQVIEPWNKTFEWTSTKWHASPGVVQTLKIFLITERKISQLLGIFQSC